MILYIPLAAAVGSLVWILTTDMDLKWKGLAVGLLAGSLAFQFVPALQMHFLVPLLMQVFLAL